MIESANGAERRVGRMSRRTLLQGATGAAGALGLSSLKPGRGQAKRPAPAVIQGTVTLTLMYDKIEFPDDQLKLFTDANPNIKVQRIEPDDTRFKAMVAAGNPPDVFLTSGPAIPNLANRGIVLDLTDYFAGSSLLKADDLAPANSFFRYGDAVGQGALYGMCKDWSPDFTMFAFKQAFEEAEVPLPSETEPMRYADFLTLGQALTKRRGERIQRIGVSYGDWTIEPLIQFRLSEEGGRLYAPDDASIALKDSPGAVEVLRLFYDLAAEKVTWTPLTPSPNGWSGKDFNLGLIALIQNGYWFSGFLGTQEESKVADQVVMLPSPTWGSKRYDPSGGPAGTAIAKASKNPDAAWKLFEFYNGDVPAQNRAKSGWGVPALTSLYGLMPAETPFQQQVQKVLQEELKHGDAPIEVNPYYDRQVFTTSWQKHLEQALRGSISFDQLVSNIEGDVNQAIKDGLAALGR